MKLSEKQSLFAHNVAKLIDYIYQKGYSCTLGEVFRTKEQAELYAEQHKGIVNSLHCKRLAIDLNLMSPQGEYLTDSHDYEHFGEYWENMHPNHRWGGRFTRQDGNHFEMQDE